MWVTGEPGELLVGLDYEPVHVVQLAEQADTGAVGAEFEATSRSVLLDRSTTSIRHTVSVWVRERVIRPRPR